MTRHAILAIGGYPDWDRDALAAEFDADFVSDPAGLSDMPESRRAELRAVAYMGHAPFGAAEMDLLPNLGLVANFGVGYDAIDVAAADARGVTVTNTPDVLNDDVADLAVGMLLAFSRAIVEGERWVRSGDWAAKGAMPLQRKVGGRRAGIVGLGRIGREIADRLAALKMEIHYHSRSEKDVPEGWIYHADPVDLARASDDIFVALVGGPETRGYVGAEALEALGPDGVVVNISRGSTIDEAALLDALEKGTIRGAALDVFENEPDIDPRFATLGNALLQPHQGSATVETRKAMGALQRENLAAFFAGAQLPTPVN